MIGSVAEPGAFPFPHAANARFPSQSCDHQHRHCGDDVYEYYPSASSLVLNSIEMKGCKGEDYSFPVRLHNLLDVLQHDNLSHLASWMPHGRCFVVHNPEEFSQKVLPLWFRQSRFGSFQRQLNLYGFRRMKTGRDKGGYYHSCFIRGLPYLVQNIKRIKAKKTKGSDDEVAEPNFYSMPFVPNYPPPAIAMQPVTSTGPNRHFVPPLQHPPPASLLSNHAPASPAPGHATHYPEGTIAYESNIPALSVPHFDAENVPVPTFSKNDTGPGEINVPLLQSKLLASPSRHVLTQSLSYAYTRKDEVAAPTL